MNKYSEINYIIFIFTICISLILIYGYIKCRYKIKDHIQTKIIYDVDIWALLHILIFFILTFIFPNQYILLFILGIMWEITEHLLGSYFKYINIKCLSQWWYFRYIDILYNLFGIILAKILLKIIS